jgi:hypothetical protein
MLMKSRIDRRSLLGAGAASLMLGGERLGRNSFQSPQPPPKCRVRHRARP